MVREKPDPVVKARQLPPAWCIVRFQTKSHFGVLSAFVCGRDLTLWPRAAAIGGAAHPQLFETSRLFAAAKQLWSGHRLVTRSLGLNIVRISANERIAV
jgi:hypothetical protein